MSTFSRYLRRTSAATILFATSTLPLTTLAQENDVLDEVIVTGSRIARPNLVQPTPVTTLSSDDLRMAGTPDMGKTLADLPSLGSTGTLAGNSNSFADTAGLNQPDLRRLGINRTLTLVNGKRHVGASPGTTAVDLNSIPNALVERVEIITGGASAVYGSDAVSGVINIVTRQDFEGVQVNAEMGDSWSGDYGDNYQVGLTLGHNFDDDRGNFTFSISRDKLGDVQASDVRHAHEYGTYINPENTGENDGIPDTIVSPNVLSEYIDENGVLMPDALTSFSSADGLIAFRNDGTPLPQTLRDQSNSFAFGTFPNGCDYCFKLEDYITIIPSVVRTAFNATARYQIAEPVSLYVDAKYVAADVQEELQPSFDFFTLEVNVEDNPFLNEQLRAELLDQGVTSAVINRFHADAGSRRNNIERETKRIVTGFEGDLGSGPGHVSYDLFFNYGETSNTVQGQNRQVPQNLQAAVDAIRDPVTGQIVCRDPDAAAFGGCVPFNPFGRTNSPEAISFSFVQTTEEQTLTQANAGLSLVSDTSAFFELPGGPIGWAAGVEWREEKTSTDGDALVQSDLTESAAQPDQHGGYRVGEAFVEVTVPILSNAFLAHTLSLDAAYRAADYSHAGNANAWKVGAIWAPIEQLRFRGTVSEAVRAPNIIEAFLPATPGFAEVDDPCDVDLINDDPDRTANCAALGLPPDFQASDNAGVDSESSGNKNLDPEESRSYTFGLVYQPTWAQGLSLTIDYYDIEIVDAIVEVAAQDIVENCVDKSGGPDATFCSLYTRDPTTQDINFVRSTFVNASKLETQGVDVELRYAHALLGGNFTGSFVGTYLKKLNEFVFQDRPDEINVERGEIGDPIHAYRAALTYEYGPLAFGWTGTYVGSVKRYAVGEDICEDISPCDVDSSTIHDLNVRYHLPVKNMEMEVYAGVNNVLDEAPPYGLLGVEVDEAIYDALGRRYFIGLRSTF